MGEEGGGRGRGVGGWVKAEIQSGERRGGRVVRGAGGRCERGGERGRDVAWDLTSDCRLPSQRAGMRLRQGEKML